MLFVCSGSGKESWVNVVKAFENTIALTPGVSKNWRLCGATSSWTLSHGLTEDGKVGIFHDLQWAILHLVITDDGWNTVCCCYNIRPVQAAVFRLCLKISCFCL